MTRVLLAAILALTLTGCALPALPPRDRYLMYWPALDGAPVTAERGPF